MDNKILIKLASLFCPKCWSPTKKRKSKNGNFRLYCSGYNCEMTVWYPTEREAREAWIDKSAQILGIVEEE